MSSLQNYWDSSLQSSLLATMLDHGTGSDEKWQEVRTAHITAMKKIAISLNVTFADLKNLPKDTQLNPAGEEALEEFKRTVKEITKKEKKE